MKGMILNYCSVCLSVSMSVIASKQLHEVSTSFEIVITDVTRIAVNI